MTSWIELGYDFLITALQLMVAHTVVWGTVAWRILRKMKKKVPILALYAVVFLVFLNPIVGFLLLRYYLKRQKD